MKDLINVNRRVANMVDFIKTKVKSNLLECRNSGDIDISDDNLAQITSVIDRSISQGFQLSYGDVENLIASLLKNR